MHSNLKTILITGGAGFIGSHLVRQLVHQYPHYRIVNYDNLTYAGNLYNLTDVASKDNYYFVKGDICDKDQVTATFEKFNIDSVIHLAAESHVDRSIEDPLAFLTTNIVGTVNLLTCCRGFWKEDFDKKLFYHISTDEVYGSLGSTGLFSETTSYDPQSPYSASKASSDHFVRAFSNTYGLPIKMSNCSNNYGPNQFPEKLIPLFIQNIINEKPLPVYGSGANIRDWLYVEDHARAIDLIFHEGKLGETYNIGGLNEWKNIDLVLLLCETMDKALKRPTGSSKQLIDYVKDRAGHDLRYAIDASKIQHELNWSPKVTFESGLAKTVQWYLDNTAWLEHIASGKYREYQP